MYADHYVSVIVPAHNEELSIALVLEQLASVVAPVSAASAGPSLIDEVVVCNNSSTDRTGAVARTVTSRYGWQVVEEGRPGYGAACHAAIEALKQKPGEEIIVFVDADASVRVSELPKLLAEISAGADLVVGSRVTSRREPGAMTLAQRAGNHFATMLVGLLWHRRISDLGPFRAIRRSELDRIGMRDRRFGWTVEMQVRAIQLGLDLREVPVTVRKRIGKSKISGTVRGVTLAGYDIVATILKLFLEEKRCIKSARQTAAERSV